MPSPTPPRFNDARDQVCEQFAAMFPKTGELTADTKAARLAFTAFPKAHRQKI